MKNMIRGAAVIAAFTLTAQAHADFISGNITSSGIYNGIVDSADAWINANPVDGENVNFWTLTGAAGDKISITVNGDIEFGISLYQGLIEQFELFVPGFSNTGSFADNTFVAGTPFFGATGTQLLDIILPAAGTYTIAVGGEDFNFGSSFNYAMSVEVAPAVPVPAAAWLMGSALVGLAGVARRKK